MTTRSLKKKQAKRVADTRKLYANKNRRSARRKAGRRPTVPKRKNVTRKPTKTKSKSKTKSRSRSSSRSTRPRMGPAIMDHLRPLSTTTMSSFPFSASSDSIISGQFRRLDRWGL